MSSNEHTLSYMATWNNAASTCDWDYFPENQYWLCFLTWLTVTCLPTAVVMQCKVNCHECHCVICPKKKKTKTPTTSTGVICCFYCQICKGSNALFFLGCWTALPEVSSVSKVSVGLVHTSSCWQEGQGRVVLLWKDGERTVQSCFN